MGDENDRKKEISELLDALSGAHLKNKSDHKFWKTQPVPQSDSDLKDTENKEIEPAKDVADIRNNSLGLPKGYEWFEFEVSDDKQMEEIYHLLSDNYVEDDDNMFRFDYDMNFLRWAFTPPGWRKDWHIGVRTANGLIVGVIVGTPLTMIVAEKSVEMVSINFLCVHKKLRNKRLAPVLIREITRRVNLTGIFQAVYTAGKMLPTPVSSARYYHRTISARKLVECEFTYLPKKMTMKTFERLCDVRKIKPEANLAVRPFKAATDAKAVAALLAAYLKKFAVYQNFTEDQIAHWLTSRKDIVQSFVTVDPSSATPDEPTDVFSFYTISSSVLKHSVHKSIKTGYAFYYTALNTPVTKIFDLMLAEAKESGHDVFNSLNIMDNEQVYDSDKRFGKGDGELHYYLFNWKTQIVPPPMIGLVML